MDWSLAAVLFFGLGVPSMVGIGIAALKRSK